MEFSDSSQLQSSQKQSLSQPNQSNGEKENQPHPLTANQSSRVNMSKHVEQPRPSAATVVEQPHPSATAVHSRYYKLVKQYLAVKNKDGCGISHDAWTLTCEYFNTIQPHPLITMFDWSELALHEN